MVVESQNGEAVDKISITQLIGSHHRGDPPYMLPGLVSTEASTTEAGRSACQPGQLPSDGRDESGCSACGGLVSGLFDAAC